MSRVVKSPRQAHSYSMLERLLFDVSGAMMSITMIWCRLVDEGR